MQIEEEKREHDQKMKKMEAEMEQVFEMKVKEKKQKLKDSENDVSLIRMRFGIFMDLPLQGKLVNFIGRKIAQTCHLLLFGDCHQFYWRFEFSLQLLIFVVEKICSCKEELSK